MEKNEDIIIEKYTFPKETFVGGSIIPAYICDNMIEYFNLNKNIATSGVTYNSAESKLEVDTYVKESLDLPISHESYHYPLLDYRKAVHNVLVDYFEDYQFAPCHTPFNIVGGYNIQYYQKGGGYKTWHHERGGVSHATRLFTFATYLNDVEDGGTDFYYQNITVPAIKGLTVIFPCEWTHTHRSQVSEKGEKYIATGWYCLMNQKADGTYDMPTSG